MKIYIFFLWLVSTLASNEYNGRTKDDLLQHLVAYCRRNKVDTWKDSEYAKETLRTLMDSKIIDCNRLEMWLHEDPSFNATILVENVDHASFSQQIQQMRQTNSQADLPCLSNVLSEIPVWEDERGPLPIDGLHAYAFTCEHNKSGYHTLIVITDRHAKVVAKRLVKRRAWAVKMINSTTLFYGESTVDTKLAHLSVSSGVIWNLKTGVTRTIGLGTMGHDCDYDERTDTWVAPMAYQKVMRCSSNNRIFSCHPDVMFGKNRVKVSYDVVEERDSNGRTLWKWNPLDFLANWTRNHGQLRMLRTAKCMNYETGTIFQDVAHINGIFIDHTKNLVYANSRHLGTAFAIERGTGKLRWSCGRFGTIPSLRGKVPIVSHFTHSHIFYPAGNNHYYTFNNNLVELVGKRYVERDPVDSQVQLLRLDPDGIREVATFTGKRRIYGGGLQPLPKGRFVATFGDGVLDKQWVMVEGSWDARTNHTRLLSVDAFIYFPTKFYVRPILDVTLAQETNQSGGPQQARVCAWDSFLRRRPGTGVLTTTSTDEACAALCPEVAGKQSRMEIVLKAFWEESCLHLSVPSGSFALKLENADGLTNRVHVRRPCACK